MRHGGRRSMSGLWSFKRGQHDAERHIDIHQALPTVSLPFDADTVDEVPSLLANDVLSEVGEERWRDLIDSTMDPDVAEVMKAFRSKPLHSDDDIGALDMLRDAVERPTADATSVAHKTPAHIQPCKVHALRSATGVPSVPKAKGALARSSPQAQSKPCVKVEASTCVPAQVKLLDAQIAKRAVLDSKVAIRQPRTTVLSDSTNTTFAVPLKRNIVVSIVRQARTSQVTQPLKPPRVVLPCDTTAARGSSATTRVLPSATVEPPAALIVLDPRRAAALHREQLATTSSAAADKRRVAQENLEYVVVAFRARTLLRHYGFAPWRNAVIAIRSKADDVFRATILRRSLLLWKKVCSNGRQLRHVLSAIKQNRLCRRITYAATRLRFRMWVQWIAVRRLQLQMAVLTNLRKTFKRFVLHSLRTRQRRERTRSIVCETARAEHIVRMAIRRWRARASRARENIDREAIRARLRLVAKGDATKRSIH
jgi:hypothetical protein